MTVTAASWCGNAIRVFSVMGRDYAYDPDTLLLFEPGRPGRDLMCLLAQSGRDCPLAGRCTDELMPESCRRRLERLTNWSSRLHRAGRMEAAVAQLEQARRQGLVLAPQPVPAARPPAPVSLWLTLTDACNLSCRYCYRGPDSVRTMTPAIMEQAINWFFSAFPREVGTADLVFFGGEPLLEFDLLQQGTRRFSDAAAAQGVGARFHITTNGTLLTAEVQRFFAQHQFRVTISTDGLAEIQDHLRPLVGGSSSHEAVVLGVRGLRGNVPALSARMTVCRQHLGHLRDCTRYLFDMGFHNVSHRLVSTDNPDVLPTPEEIIALAHESSTCADESIQRLISGRLAVWDRTVGLLRRIHYRVPGGGCPFGSTASPKVSVIGGLFTCQRMLDVPEFQVGSISRGLDPGPKPQPRESPGCSQCWARGLCGGGCAHLRMGYGREASAALCEDARIAADHALRSYIRLSREAPAALQAIVGPRAEMTRPVD